MSFHHITSSNSLHDKLTSTSVNKCWNYEIIFPVPSNNNSEQGTGRGNLCWEEFGCVLFGAPLL